MISYEALQNMNYMNSKGKSDFNPILQFQPFQLYGTDVSLLNLSTRRNSKWKSQTFLLGHCSVLSIEIASHTYLFLVFRRIVDMYAEYKVMQHHEITCQKREMIFYSISNFYHFQYCFRYTILFINKWQFYCQ